MLIKILDPITEESLNSRALPIVGSVFGFVAVLGFQPVESTLSIR